MATMHDWKKICINILFICGSQHILKELAESVTMRAWPYLNFAGFYMESLLIVVMHVTFQNNLLTAAGVVPCGGRKTSPRTSTIVQFIFYFGPLRSAIIF